MAKVDQIFSSLQKLYSQRGILNKQILDAEKKLAAEVNAAAKPAKKPAAKKPAAKKPAAKKPVAKKPAVKKPAVKKPAVKKPVAKKAVIKPAVPKSVSPTPAVVKPAAPVQAAPAPIPPKPLTPVQPVPESVEDAVFGKIFYDGSWYRKFKINFFNKEINIELIIDGDEDAEFEVEQYEAYKALMDNWPEIHTRFLEPILKYYINERKGLGYDTNNNVNYPQIDTVEQLLEHIALLGIVVPYAGLYGEGRSIGISFDCTWDDENGVGLRLFNEQVVEVGGQDVVF